MNDNAISGDETVLEDPEKGETGDAERANPSVPEANSATSEDFHSLDSRHITLERIGGAILSLFLAVGAIVGCVISGFAMSFTFWWWVVVAGAVFLLTGICIMLFVWPAVAHRHARWRLDATGLEIRRGVFWRHQISVPLARLQHADISQGPLQRRFGLATLIVHTAGTHDASVPLEGLAIETATWLRDQLIRQKEIMDVV